MHRIKLIMLCVVAAIGLAACAGAPDYDPVTFNDNNSSAYGWSNFDECGACGGWQQDWGHRTR